MPSLVSDTDPGCTGGFARAAQADIPPVTDPAPASQARPASIHRLALVYTLRVISLYKMYVRIR